MRRLLQAMCVLLVISTAVPLSTQESIEDARERREQIQREAAEAAAELDVLAAEDAALVEALERLDAWIAAHPEEINREYEQNRHRYTGLEPQVRAHAIWTPHTTLAYPHASRAVHPACTRPVLPNGAVTRALC